MLDALLVAVALGGQITSCGTLNQIEQQLASLTHESVVFDSKKAGLGGARIVITKSDTGTWTFIASKEDGSRACMLDSDAGNGLHSPSKDDQEQHL
jgi:hypothetical protein